MNGLCFDNNRKEGLFSSRKYFKYQETIYLNIIPDVVWLVALMNCVGMVSFLRALFTFDL